MVGVHMSLVCMGSAIVVLPTAELPKIAEIKENKNMCINCEGNILNEALVALEPVFEQFGKREVINAIHDYFHAGQPDINVMQVTDHA